MAWSAYSLTADVIPGSFPVDLPVIWTKDSRPRTSSTNSFVTLTTAGYGNITPLSSVTRTLSMMGVVCGVLLVAVLIARMVGAMGGWEKVVKIRIG